jgi:hypothetical protein
MRRIITVMIIVGSLLSTVFAEPKEPTAQIDTLIKRLQSGKVDGALLDFFSGSLMLAQKGEQLRAMDGQAKAAFEFLGKPVSYEIVQTSTMGTSLVRIKWITKHKNETPLFWNSLFYRRNSKWEPLGVFFFDDPQKAGFI